MYVFKNMYSMDQIKSTRYLDQFLNDLSKFGKDLFELYLED